MKESSKRNANRRRFHLGRIRRAGSCDETAPAGSRCNSVAIRTMRPETRPNRSWAQWPGFRLIPPCRLARPWRLWACYGPERFASLPDDAHRQLRSRAIEHLVLQRFPLQFCVQLEVAGFGRNEGQRQATCDELHPAFHRGPASRNARLTRPPAGVRSPAPAARSGAPFRWWSSAARR